MKKIVVSLELHDNNGKQKAMKAVSTLSGIDSISIDMKEQKMTVIGAVDPVHVVRKLKKSWQAKLFSVGPAKEPEKKEEAKKEEPKKDEPKKEEPKKPDEAEKKKEASPNPNPSPNPYPNEMMIAEMVRAYQAYNPHMTTHYYVKSAEENPNSCVIC